MKRLALLLILAVAVLSVPPLAADEDKPLAPKPVNVPMADRPCLAVVSFDDGSLQRQEWWGPKWDVGSGLADILTTTILDRNRFRLLERNLLEKVVAEQDFGASGRVDPKTASKIGRITGADYLIMGKVTQFSWDTKKTGILIPLGGLGGLGASQTKARVAVDLRIVDATTAEILGSYTGKGEESKGSLIVAHSEIGGLLLGSSDFMNTILGQATRKAISEWCDSLCRAQDEKKLNLVAKHRPVMRPDGVVLYAEGSTIIANTGTAKGYAVGDKVEIHRKGRELRDPDTGEILRVLTELIGTGVIVKADEKTADISFARMDTSKAAVEGDLLRFVAPPVVATPPIPAPTDTSSTSAPETPSGGSQEPSAQP